MTKLKSFFKVFFECVAISTVAWLVFGGLLSLIVPDFTLVAILAAGVGGGASIGLVNGLFNS